MLPATPLLPPPLLAMVRRGVSVIASSCSRELVPSVMRAVGSDVSEDGTRVRVYLARTQSRQLLQDVADTGRIAVVFSEPSTHRTVQLKSAHARLQEPQEADALALRRYLAAMEHEIALIGFAPAFTRAMLRHQLDDVAVVCFTPEQAFDQTPGPRAGELLPPRQP